MTLSMTRRSLVGRLAGIATMIASGSGLGGCIQISAPDKPIEINLNVNIRQEVVVSLREDVKNLDQQYPGVF